MQIRDQRSGGYRCMYVLPTTHQGLWAMGTDLMLECNGILFTAKCGQESVANLLENKYMGAIDYWNPDWSFTIASGQYGGSRAWMGFIS